VLWRKMVQEEQVLVLYSDAAACMLKAATALKVVLPECNSFYLYGPWTTTCGGRREK
jgi:hypothetical protein